MFTRADLETLAEALREAARVEILPRFRKLSADAVRQKTSAIDLVTDADEAAERHIVANLSKAFPSALFVGEENTEKDKSLLARIAHADLSIIIDPIDGTANFASGLPLFGVMAGVAVRGEIVAGAIYDPMVEDWALALRGEGAWSEELDGTTQDLRVAHPAPVPDMIGTLSLNMLPEPKRTLAAGNAARFRDTYVFRDAAHEYRLLASGHTHFAMYDKLMPWDHVPGSLIAQEAGAYVARFDGSPYNATTHEGGLIAAPDRDSWQAIHDAIFQER